MKLQILGTGCPKCALLKQRADEAVRELGIEATVEKVTDIAAIAAMGVMTTPALAVDGKVVSSGRVLSVEQVKAFISGGRFMPR